MPQVFMGTSGCRREARWRIGGTGKLETQMILVLEVGPPSEHCQGPERKDVSQT